MKLLPLFLAPGISLLHAEQPAAIPSGVIDHGQIQQQVEAAARAGQKRVVIAPGAYRLRADGGPAHLVFKNLHDLEIVAEGVSLIFTTPEVSSVRFDHCRNVTFRGATLLRDPLPYSQGRIVALGPKRKTVDIRIDRGYPTNLEYPHAFGRFWPILYDGEGHWAEDLFPYYGSPERLGPDIFRLSGRGAPAGLIRLGSHVAWNGYGATDLDLIECQDMKIIGVTIRGGVGFCVHENQGDGRNYYSYDVKYPAPPRGATEKPLLASNFDAFHSTSMRHGPTLENCHFEGMGDDGIAIQGKYALVEEVKGSAIVLRPRYTADFSRAGDTLRFNDPDGVFAGEARVVSTHPVAYTPNQPPPANLHEFQDPATAFYQAVTLDQAVPARFGWLAANASACGDGFVIRHCTVHYNRARSMLIKASDGLIEDCTVEGSCLGGIVLTPEMDFWDESDYSRNVVIRHNTLINENYNQRPGWYQAGALTVAACERDAYVPLPGGHRNIMIENNTFQDDDGANVVISSAQGVTLTGNHFVQPMRHENARGSALGVNPGALIWLTECSGVKISGNTLSHPGPFLEKDIDSTGTANGTGFQDGVKQP